MKTSAFGVPADLAVRDSGTERLPQDRARRLVPALTLAALLLLYAIVTVRTAWLSDDAYITLRTIDNFINGYGLRWNVAERVQVYTHPLWLLLLTGLCVLTREFYLTVLVFSMIVSFAAVALLGWRACRLNVHPSILIAALSVLIVSRAFMDYSTSGLENPLTHLLLVGFVVLFLAAQESSVKRQIGLGLLAGLGTLNRMDSITLFLPPLTWELCRRRSWKRAWLVLIGFTPFLLWEAFSVVYYGFPLPNTAYAKLPAGISHVEYWEHALAYFKNSLVRDPITLAAIGGGMIVGLTAGNWKGRALVASMACYLFYVVNIGGDFMSGRFFAAPLLVMVALMLETGVHLHAGWARRLLPVSILFVGCIGTTPTMLSAKDYGHGRTQVLDDSGVADERAFYYPMTGLLTDTPLTERPFSEACVQARKTRRTRDPLLVLEAVGFMGFLAGPETYVVDYHALGDPLLSRLPMVKSDPIFSDFCATLSGHPCSLRWRTGHYRRNLPAGYLNTILAGENRLVDDHLHRFYEAIRLITRGPIWSAERCLAIARMNLGLYDDLLGPMDQVEFRPTRFAETYEQHPDVASVTLLSGAARDYAERGAHEEALSCLRKLLAIDATDAYAWTNLGNSLMQLGQLHEAIGNCQHALQLKPDFSEAHNVLGVALARSGEPQEAIGHFEQALQLKPNYPEAHNNLGSLLAQTGQLEEAIDHFQQALRLKPDYADARNNLGAALAMSEHR